VIFGVQEVAAPPCGHPIWITDRFHITLGFALRIIELRSLREDGSWKAAVQERRQRIPSHARRWARV